MTSGFHGAPCFGTSASPASLHGPPVVTALRASASPDANPHELCQGQSGNCTEGFFQCGTCRSDVGDGSFCFAYFDRDGNLGFWSVCAEDSFCSELQPCLRRTDCPKGYACITRNGCTGCGLSTGVCDKKCRKGLAGSPPARVRRRTPARLGRTTTG